MGAIGVISLVMAIFLYLSGFAVFAEAENIIQENFAINVFILATLLLIVFCLSRMAALIKKGQAKQEPVKEQDKGQNKGQDTEPQQQQQQASKW